MVVRMYWRIETITLEMRYIYFTPIQTQTFIGGEDVLTYQAVTPVNNIGNALYLFHNI